MCFSDSCNPVPLDQALCRPPDLPGLGLRAYASGRRQWVAQYRDGTGRTRRATFGDPRTVGLDEAREGARKLLSRVELGSDPQAEKRAARRAVRVGLLVDAYSAEAMRRLKPRSYAEVRRHLCDHAKPLHHDAASEVGRATVVRLLDTIARASGPVAANRVRGSLGAMWVWGLRSGTIEGENPIAKAPKPGIEAPRERVLTDGELALIWRCTEGGHDHDRIVRMLLPTGARREEVAGMDWSEVDGAVWVLPGARSKNGLPHVVPLGPLALAQLPTRRPGRSLVFGEGEGGGLRVVQLQGTAEQPHGQGERSLHRAAWSGAERSRGLKPWVLHDLRRTVSTWLSENGTEPHVVEAVLNHVSGAAKRGVAGIYNRAQYREPKRAALARWEAHIRTLAGLPALDDGKAVALRGAA